MPKETLYFTHDFGARNDPKMINLQIKHGMMGIGCYWCLVEILNEQGGEIPLEYERISFELRIDTNVLKSIINDFDLFIIEDKMLSSRSVLKRIEIRRSKSAKARESINKRWENHIKNTNVSKNDTNVQKNDTKKERKESKENTQINNLSAPELNSDPVLHSSSDFPVFKLSHDELQKDFLNSESWIVTLIRNNPKLRNPETVKRHMIDFCRKLSDANQYPITFREASNRFAGYLEKRINERTEHAERKSLEKRTIS